MLRRPLAVFSLSLALLAVRAGAAPSEPYLGPAGVPAGRYPGIRCDPWHPWSPTGGATKTPASGWARPRV